MSNEFEDREKELHQEPDNLGNLPQDTARQKGTAINQQTPHDIPSHTGMLNMGAASLPADIEKNFQTLGVDKETKLGSPSIPASVTSVYDARPINARDWMITQYPTTNLGVPEAADTLEATFAVPEGFVGVLRRFRWQPGRLLSPSNEDLGDGSYIGYIPSVTLLVDNIVVPDYDGLKFGVSMVSPADTFVLAAAGSIFKMRLIVSSAFKTLYNDAGLGGNLAFKFEMYGQLLLTRGLPLPFEVSSQIKSGDL